MKHHEEHPGEIVGVAPQLKISVLQRDPLGREVELFHILVNEREGRCRLTSTLHGYTNVDAERDCAKVEDAVHNARSALIQGRPRRVL